jgi:hypothetical protein
MDYTYTPVTEYKRKIYNPTNVVLCCYKTFNIYNRPFLQYLLANVDNSLDFPRYSIESLVNKPLEKVDSNNNPALKKVLSTNQVFKIARKFLFPVTGIEHHTMMYAGYKKYNGDVYLFIDVSCSNLKVCQNAQFCLIDEMINVKRVYEKSIDPRVTNFVQNNISSFTMLDTNNQPFELPTAVYLGCDEANLNFTYTFGNKKSHDNTILGPHYYFTDYENAAKHYGTVRFALFTDRMLVKQNFPNDTIDESLLKQQRLDNNHLNHKYQLMTQRITDYDGNWATNYDSVYLGRIELDDGQMLQNTPIIVAKSYDQQIPLDYCVTP